MAEYVPLLVVIAVLVVLAVSFVGPWISDQLFDASEPMDPDASQPVVGASIGPFATT